jgi:hypothetical protein
LSSCLFWFPFSIFMYFLDFLFLLSSFSCPPYLGLDEGE